MSAPEFVDDPEIVNADVLLRRIPNWPSMVTVDAQGRARPTSAALDLRPGETYCSVDVQSRLRDPTDPFITVEGHPSEWGLASCTADDARRDGLHWVAGDPLPDNPAHTRVIPTATSRKARKRNFGKLAACMTFLREPMMPGPR